MDFALVISLIRWEVTLFTAGLAAIIGVKALTGKVNTRFLLHGLNRDGAHYFSPERVQMLLATIGVAIQYLMLSVRTVASAMPNLPNGTLEVLGLSHAVYLGGNSLGHFAIDTQRTRGEEIIQWHSTLFRLQRVG